MKDHLSDADLVALALLPDESPDARIHLASCRACADRMDRATTELARHRLDHETTVDSRDATFWKRQELSIMREVSRSGRPAGTRRSFLAAAIVAVAIGGFWFGRVSVEPAAPTSAMATAASQMTPSGSPTTPGGLVPATAVSTDPWETESLSEFQSVVDWESWVEDDGKEAGTI